MLFPLKIAQPCACGLGPDHKKKASPTRDGRNALPRSGGLQTAVFEGRFVKRPSLMPWPQPRWRGDVFSVCMLEGRKTIKRVSSTRSPRRPRDLPVE